MSAGRPRPRLRPLAVVCLALATVQGDERWGSRENETPSLAAKRMPGGETVGPILLQSRTVVERTFSGSGDDGATVASSHSIAHFSGVHVRTPGASDPTLALNHSSVTSVAGYTANVSALLSHVGHHAHGMHQRHYAAIAIGVLMLLLVFAAFVYSDKTHVPNIFYRKAEQSRQVIDSMTYETKGLSNWSVFHAYSNTVWHAENLWGMMRNLALVSILVAFAEVLLAPDPSDLDPLRFAKIGVVLNVFVALLLGFLLSSSVNKWWCCIDGFLSSFNSLRNLQMQLHALGVEQSKIDLCLRYGILAGWLLVAELRQGAHLSDVAKQQAEKRMFDDLETRGGDSKTAAWRLLPKERVVLESISGQRPSMMWMWIGSFIGRMAQDGDIPPMQSPTYGRIVNLAQDAQAGMRQVRSAIQVQMPFVYIHTLSTIVQVNNLLAAVSYGLTLGVAVSAILVRINPNFRLYDEAPKLSRSLMEHSQALLIQTFQCFVGPIIYQSFLEIGVAISHPFAHQEYGVFPVEAMLERLEEDMADCNRVVVAPPAWERPRYKK